MTTTTRPPTTRPPSAEERLLTGALLVAPLVYLVADTTYAVRGWDDPLAGSAHVLGAIGYGLVVLRIAGWLPAPSRLRALLVLVALVGAAGNVAYGFDAIHLSLGDASLVDRSGAATLIKPLGLVFPLSLLLSAAAVWRLDRRWQAGLLAVAAVGWPVAHIGNLGAVAVAVNVALVVTLGSLALRTPRSWGPESSTLSPWPTSTT